MKNIKILTLAVLVGFSMNLFAEESEQNEVYTYESPSGVEVKFDENGELKSILATGEADFKFGDSKDIKQATQKATMRAKANIAKFLNEEVKSSEILEEITTTISSDSSSGESEALRDSTEKFVESVSTEANAILNGVVTLKSEVNKEAKIVSVTVGVKEQTINAAAKLSNQMSQAQESMQNPAKAAKQNAPVNPNVKKSAMYDNF